MRNTDDPLPTLPQVICRAGHEHVGGAAVNENPDGNSLLYELAVRFPGQYCDLETGYHYNYFRTYDPATGRYIEPNPIGQDGGTNVFVYARSNPTSRTDRTGHIAVLAPFLGAVGASAEAAAVASAVALASIGTSDAPGCSSAAPLARLGCCISMRYPRRSGSPLRSRRFPKCWFNPWRSPVRSSMACGRASSTGPWRMGHEGSNSGPAFSAAYPRPHDSHRQFTCRSRPFQNGSRSLNFWSLPVAVRASSGRNSMRLGHL